MDAHKTELEGIRVKKLQMIGFAFEMGYIIALPLILLLLAGKYLDLRYHTSPVFKISGLILALVASTTWLYRRFVEIIKSTSKDNSRKD